MDKRQVRYAKLLTYQDYWTLKQLAPEYRVLAMASDQLLREVEVAEEVPQIGEFVAFDSDQCEQIEFD